MIQYKVDFKLTFSKKNHHLFEYFTPLSTS